MMKILFAAAEAFPFIKTGGLGDVAGSLPLAMAERGHDVSVIMPKYSSISPDIRGQMKKETSFRTRLSWRELYTGIESLENKGVKFYFVDNEFFFARENIYGYGDDCERFAFFSKAVTESLEYLGFFPDVIHCNDWHTALIPVFLRTVSRHDIGTVFTVHNLKYQGICGLEAAEDILGLDEEFIRGPKGLELSGALNFMKGGILHSDLFTTVSKAYSREIQTPYYGEGLHEVIRENRGRLRGVSNGIDYDIYNPAADDAVFFNYCYSVFRKTRNKEYLQKELGLEECRSMPMLVMVSRLVEQKGIDLLMPVFGEIMESGVQLVVLGSGDSVYEDFFAARARENPGRFAFVNRFDEALAHRIYASGDIYLMPSKFEPCGTSQLVALRYGTVPVVRETGGLRDTVKAWDGKEGNGFTFYSYNAHDFLDAIKRALEAMQNLSVWRKIVRKAAAADRSWKHSALEYEKIYREVQKNG